MIVGFGWHPTEHPPLPRVRIGERAHRVRLEVAQVIVVIEPEILRLDVEISTGLSSAAAAGESNANSRHRIRARMQPLPEPIRTAQHKDRRPKANRRPSGRRFVLGRLGCCSGRAAACASNQLLRRRCRGRRCRGASLPRASLARRRRRCRGASLPRGVVAARLVAAGSLPRASLPRASLPRRRCRERRCRGVVAAASLPRLVAAGFVAAAALPRLASRRAAVASLPRGAVAASVAASVAARRRWRRRCRGGPLVGGASLPRLVAAGVGAVVGR